MKTARLLLVTLLCAMQGMSHAASTANSQQGEASYYADSLNGNKTASGEVYDSKAMTAAHRSLAFGTKVKVTYLKTGKSVEVVINDRGPFARDRIIDLSGAAAKSIGLTDDGHGKVRVEVIEP